MGQLGRRCQVQVAMQSVDSWMENVQARDDLMICWIGDAKCAMQGPQDSINNWWVARRAFRWVWTPLAGVQSECNGGLCWMEDSRPNAKQERMRWVCSDEAMRNRRDDVSASGTPTYLRPTTFAAAEPPFTGAQVSSRLVLSLHLWCYSHRCHFFHPLSSDATYRPPSSLHPSLLLKHNTSSVRRLVRHSQDLWTK